MRSRKAFFNIGSALALQLSLIFCGFVITRLYINHFGSAIYGMTASISQFLGYIALAEAGVGGVIRAALYKPLADENKDKISGIVKAMGRFFRVIAIIFSGYALVIAAFFPLLGQSGMDWEFTFSLVLIIATSTFVEYFFGITNSVLLQADQRQYLSSVLRTITTLLNLLVVIALIRLGSSIHVVKLFTSLVFMIRPFVLSFYVRKRYRIDRLCQPDNNAIKQRWDGLGQHIAFFFHTHTDVVVLTLFTNFIEVSVYSVYNLVASGIQSFAMIFTNGFEAAFGNMLAKNETTALNRNFRIYELISSSVTVILFTTAGLMLSPFITLYTRGVTDADYHREVFAFLLLLAGALYCIRQPYHSLIIAAGHFRQTNKYAFLEVGLNIFLSVILVFRFGIVGVVIGTLVAVTYRTIFSAFYLKRNILFRNVRIFILRQVVSIATSTLIVMIVCFFIPVTTFDSYVIWGVYVVLFLLIACGVTLLINIIFYREDVRNMLAVIKTFFSSKKLLSYSKND